jgi:two-component system OmpR family sensor kinase
VDDGTVVSRRRGDDAGSGRSHVEEYGGRIETDADETGTTITVVLPRADVEETGLYVNQSALTAVRPALPRLLVTLAGALVAGVPYGLVAEQLGGSVSFIGLYYGAQDPVVGWLTHEFHSIVFAFVYAGLVSYGLL